MDVVAWLPHLAIKPPNMGHPASVAVEKQILRLTAKDDKGWGAFLKVRSWGRYKMLVCQFFRL
jgi:hypothetical protein